MYAYSGENCNWAARRQQVGLSAGDLGESQGKRISPQAALVSRWKMSVDNKVDVKWMGQAAETAVR